jgi:drug/metabolite transporter (DMT)-like permease
MSVSRAHFLFLLALLSLSQAANLIKFSNTAPEVLGFWRLLLGGLLMGCWSFLKTGRIAQLSGKTVLVGFFFFIHLWSFAVAAQTTSIAHCMLLFSLHPLFTALLLLVLHKERPTAKVLKACLLAFLGLVLVFAPLNSSNAATRGDLIALLSGFLYSLYAVFAKSERQKHSNSQFVFQAYSFASLFFLATCFFTGAPIMPQTPTAWACIVGLVVFPTLAGHALFTYLMQYLNLNWMSAGKLLEPLLSSVVALMIFSEKLTLSSIAAMLCAMGAGALLLSENKTKSLS